MKSLPENQIEELARQVESHADFKVLRRLKPQKVFRVPDGRPLSKGIILDTETTGLSDTDKIIELALVVFEYDPETGEARIESAVLTVSTVASHPGKVLAGCSYGLDRADETADEPAPPAPAKAQ